MQEQSVEHHKHRNRIIQGITLERIQRSLGNRTMRQIARFGFVRSLASLGYSGNPGVQSNLFPGIDISEVVESISSDGIWRSFQLPPNILRELQEFSYEAPIYGNRNMEHGFKLKDLMRAQEYLGIKFTVANYFNAYEQCSAVRQIAKDPVLNEIALRYVGPRAQFLGTSMWWSFANQSKQTDQNNYAQLFHYDLDDYKFLKFFFYLTDVDLDSGPHVYVTGSHRKKPWSHLYPMRRLQDDEIEKTYEKKAVLVLEGQTGTGFVEDTFGIHKGTPPISKKRLIIEFYYAISRGFTDGCDPKNLKMLDI